MDLDKETLIKIAETHTHVQHILDALDEGKENFKDCNNRVRELELNQNLAIGKMTILIAGIGGCITLIFNGLLWIFGHK